ncbi:MAG: hypothetical protein ACK5G9_00880 [Akkermansiaceae bacterium]
MDGWVAFCRGGEGFMEQMDDKSFPRMRRSECADASLRAEIELLKKMTPLERANAALVMGKIF